jgi:hypothetical protein
MTPDERRKRLDAYAAGRLLRKHFPAVRAYPDEAARAVRGAAPSVARNPRAVTADDAGRVGGPRA